MATTVQNPFDTQQPKPTGTGIVGSTIAGSNTGNLAQQPTTSGALPTNVGTSAMPANNQAATMAPVTRQVNQQTDTMSGQVNSILAKDSPLMQRARTMATQQMGQRGLINSSMAQGAGVAAMTDRALPIAQQDAQTYTQTASENMAAANQAGQFNTGEINRFGMQRNEQQFQSGEAALGRNFNREMAQLQESGMDSRQAKEIVSRETLANLDRVFQSSESELGRGFNRQMAQLQESGMDGRQAKEIASRETLSKLDQMFQSGETALARDFNRQMAELQESGLTFRQAKDIASTEALLKLEQGFQTRESSITRDFNKQMAQLQESGLDFRQAREIASREASAKLEQAGITNRFDKELALKSDMFNVEQINADRRQIVQNDAELKKLGLQINANRQDIPTAFAANISKTTMDGVNAIMADGLMTPDAKRGAIQNLVTYANSQISWASAFYGTTIPVLRAP